MKNEIFNDLFVLEMANNHWGKIERGINIIEEYAKVVKRNNVKASMKLQIRNVDTFIHKDYLNRDDIRYIWKTKSTKMSAEEYGTLINAIKKNGMIPSATAFDEKSVDLCNRLGIEIIKIASSDLSDQILNRKISQYNTPVIVSTGGANLNSIDKIVNYYEEKGIPLAINHCISLYPSEDKDLELNQIDFLKERYKNNVIGFSTHEYHDWETSIIIAYAKGARTFERHVDIDKDGINVSKYCSLPEQVDKWFKAFNRAKLMCGNSEKCFIKHNNDEVEYLDKLVRGAYCKRKLLKGEVVNSDDIYYAIPLLKGQFSSRELIVGHKLLKDIDINKPILISDLEGVSKNTKEDIINRGM